MKFALKKKPLEVAFRDDPTCIVELRRPTGAETVDLRQQVFDARKREPAINPATQEPIYEDRCGECGSSIGYCDHFTSDGKPLTLPGKRQPPKKVRQLVYTETLAMPAEQATGLLRRFVTDVRGLEDPETGVPIAYDGDPEFLLEPTFDVSGGGGSLFGDILNALTGFGEKPDAKAAGSDSGKADSGPLSP